MDDHETTHWSKGLPSVIFSINTRTTATTKRTPFQLVFGQDPRTDYHHWRAVYDASLNGPVEIDDLLIDFVKPSTKISENKPVRSVSFSAEILSVRKHRKRSWCKNMMVIDLQL